MYNPPLWSVLITCKNKYTQAGGPMALIEWKQEYAVGNDSIDYEHEHLITQINELYDELSHSVDPVTIESMLDDLQAEISTHFALEELLMREAAFEEYEAHKHDHEDLLDQIHDMIFTYSEDPESGREVLMNKLSDWFSRHFVSFDARLHGKLG
jgi:hemerythrin